MFKTKYTPETIVAVLISSEWLKLWTSNVAGMPGGLWEDIAPYTSLWKHARQI